MGGAVGSLSILIVPREKWRTEPREPPSSQSLAILPPKLRDWVKEKTGPSPARQNANPRLALRTKFQKLLQLDSRSEERVKRCRRQNTVTFPAQRYER